MDAPVDNPIAAAPPGSPPPTAMVLPMREMLVHGKPILVRSRSYLDGEAVTLSDADARALHALGRVTAVDPLQFNPPLSPVSRPSKRPDPVLPGPPTQVKVVRGTPMFLATVHVKGDLVTLPESVACRWIASGAAQLGKAQVLSARGVRFLGELKQRVTGASYG